MEMQAR